MIQPRDYCIYHWKLEDRLAEIGIDFDEFGTPVWNPVKFANGFYNDSGLNYLKTPSFNDFTPNEFIFEKWMASDFNVTNGNSGSSVYTYWTWRIGATNDYIFNSQYANPYFSYFAISVGGVYTDFRFFNGSWSAGDKVHMMWVFNRAGIAGGPNTIRFFINGIQLNQSNTAINNQVNTGGNLYLGVYSTGVAQGEHCHTAQDNIKIYGVGSTAAEVIAAIVANKDNEEWPEFGGFRMLDGGLKSPMTEGVMLN